MPPGADKQLGFMPAGAIGLVIPDAIVMLKFDEPSTTIAPQDSAGSLADLATMAGFTTPGVSEGACGRARSFVPGSTTALFARDLVAGSSLATRDVTIQTIIAIDCAGQLAAGTGRVICRGATTSSSEYAAYYLEVLCTNATARTCQVRMRWQSTAGVVSSSTPTSTFTAPLGFTLLTATRRWVSPTSVVLRYYIGDQRIDEFSSSDGSIGGGTVGQMAIGAGATAVDYFAGAIDEIAVVPRELTKEEIAATWFRITQYQPLGVQLYLDMHDQGFPMPTDPGSDVQLDNRMTGIALGYAAAQAENVRQCILPTRAYGSVLDDWETVTRASPLPPRDVDTRRSRVVARIRQRRGSSLQGLRDALQGLLGGAPSSALQFLAFSNTISEDFTTLNPLRWDVTPTASWTAPAGTARSSPAAGSYVFDGANRAWRTFRMPVQGDAREAHLVAKVAMTTPQSLAETGIYFESAASGTYFLLGLRDTAGTFALVYERFVGWVSQGVVTLNTFGGNPASLWLHLYQTTVQGTWKAAWSTTSATAGFTISSNISHPTAAQWSGGYFRSTAATAGAAQVDIDDLVMRQPYGTRPLTAYIYLDATGLGVSPDVSGAHQIIQAIKHAFIEGTFIVSKSLLCDTVNNGFDRGPMGAL